MKEMIAAAFALAACHTSPASHRRVVPLAQLPIAEWTGGLPLAGGALTFDLSDDPDRIEDWSSVSGTIDLDCNGCVLGDDHASITSRRASAFGGTLHFGHLAFDTASAHVDIAAGDAHLVGHARGDLDIDLTAHVRAGTAGTSTVDGCLAFRASDRLKARDPKMDAMVQLTGAPIGADGRFYISIRGQLGALRMIPSVCEP